MVPEQRLGSSIAASVRALMEGDFSAAGAVMDWLQEHRPEGLWLFRAFAGHLAACTFARGDEEPAERPIRPEDWDDFRRVLAGLFWFELYTADSTWAALAEAHERMKAARGGRFGFAGG